MRRALLLACLLAPAVVQAQVEDAGDAFREGVATLKDGREIKGAFKRRGNKIVIKKGTMEFSVPAREVATITWAKAGEIAEEKAAKSAKKAAKGAKKDTDPVAAKRAAHTRRVTAQALSWLKGRSSRSLGKLVKHPNPSRKVSSSGTYSAKKVRVYKKKVPSALTLNPLRVGKAFWSFFPPEFREGRTSSARLEWGTRVAEAMEWGEQPVMLENPKVTGVTLHRDCATVRFRAVGVYQIRCGENDSYEHCPSRYDRAWRHSGNGHPAFGFGAVDRVERRRAEKFESVWLLEGREFYLAEEFTRGEVLAAAEPEFKDSISVARWVQTGRPDGATVSDVGRVVKVEKDISLEHNLQTSGLLDRARVQLRVGGLEIVVLLAPGAPSLPVDTEAVFSAAIRNGYSVAYTVRSKQGRPYSYPVGRPAGQGKVRAYGSKPPAPKADAPAPKRGGKFCTNCGNAYSDSAVFCASCGTKRP